MAGELVSLDLFSGIGGLAYGLHQAGIKSALGVDVVDAAVDSFDHNLSPLGAQSIVGDLENRGVFAEVIRESKKLGVNLVVGGPPCQGFSQVGNHRDLANDPRNGLYRCFVAAVRRIKPRAFIMENVPGLAQRDGGKMLRVIEASLSLDGEYQVASCILNAADFGVPQSRRRLFFLGIRSRENVNPVMPVSPFDLLSEARLERKTSSNGVAYSIAGICHSKHRGGKSALDILLDPEDPRLVTAEQALGDLRNLVGSRKLRAQQGDTWSNYDLQPQSAYQRAMRRRRRKKFSNSQVPFMFDDTKTRLAAIPEGGNFRDLPPALQKRHLTDHRWGPDTGGTHLARKYFFAYRRLHPSFVSWTLNTKADCVYHYDGTRALSVREFARLSGFPDHFEILAPDKHTRYRLLGNAVPVPLAKALGLNLVDLLS